MPAASVPECLFLQPDNTIPMRSMLLMPLFAVAAVVFVRAEAGSAPAPPALSVMSALPTVQQTVPSEKESRTPAQRKINSQLLYEIYRLRGEAARKQVPVGDTLVRIDAKKRALVDVRAEVTPARMKQLESFDSVVISTSVRYQSIVAWVPLLKLEELAADPVVRAIEPAAESTTNK